MVCPIRAEIFKRPAAWYGSAVEAVAKLGALWAQAKCTVVLTGAGLSTASGIPDFRSPGGRWERYQPVTIQEFVASEAAREEYWRYKGETWQLIREAEPNPAHRALVDFASAGRLALRGQTSMDSLIALGAGSAFIHGPFVL